jgi:lipopolysaccharide heptosyltransferase II
VDSGPELFVAYDTRPPFEARLFRRARRSGKRQAQVLLRLLMAVVGYFTRSSAPWPAREDIRRILVVRVDLLGDVVLSLPAVRALRRAYPDAVIDMLVLKSTAGILKGDPDIDGILAYDPHVWRQPGNYLHPGNWAEAFGVLRALRSARYDLGVSISGDMGSILTRISGARRRVGYAREAYPFFLTDPVPGGRYRVRQHETEYVLALARAAGAATLPSDARPSLSVDPEAAAQVTGMLREARHTSGRRGPIITLHGGARNGQAKRWPTGHFARLAERLVGELDALVVLTGAPSEALLASAIEAECRYPLLNLLGRTSLLELVALLAVSDLVISGDSGPMHIAAAVQTPVIALHGPTDPALSGPISPDAIVLRRDLWCSPCYDASATAECPFDNPVCMKGLGPDMVFRTAQRRLQLAPAALASPQVVSVNERTEQYANPSPDS